MIKIKAEKIIERGIRRFKIIAIEALPEMKLPVKYLEVTRCDDWKPYVLGHVDGDVLMGNFDPGYDNQGRNINYKRTILQVGKSYGHRDFSRIMLHIIRSGKRLRNINRRIIEENANWNGVKTYKF